MQKLTILFLLSAPSFCSLAQERPTAAGGEASGIEGSVSYTIGLIDYTHHSSTDLEITEGVQQPYELFLLNLDDNISTFIEVFPNPFQELLIIRQSDLVSIEIAGQLYDVTGKLIWEGTLNSQNNFIDLKDLPPATYLLQLASNGLTTHSYQLIKN